MSRRLPIGSKITVRLENTSCVRVVCCPFVWVEMFICAESVIIRGCRFKVGLIWFVLKVPMM